MIKSVDIKIEASGKGVVNHDRTPTFLNPGSEGPKKLNNITIPKLRGFQSKVLRKDKDGKEFMGDIYLDEVDLKKNSLYISSNCIRHHLFKDESHDLHFTDSKNGNTVEKFIASESGLLRGFVIAKKNEKGKRFGALFIEDFVDKLGNGNFETLSQAGDRDKTSFYGRFTYGETKYTSYASISIERLQFLSLDSKFDREVAVLSVSKAKKLADDITKYIQGISGNENAKATFSENYFRKGSIYSTTECGILLNSEAVSVMVELMIEKIRNLYIQQSKGWMMVDDVIVDYNDTNRTMRIQRDGDANESRDSEYYSFFEEKVSDED